jgi:hypothetical protein
VSVCECETTNLVSAYISCVNFFFNNPRLTRDVFIVFILRDCSPSWVAGSLAAAAAVGAAVAVEAVAAAAVGKGCGAAAEESAAEAQQSEADDDGVVSCMAQTRNHKHSPTGMLAVVAALVAAEALRSGSPTSNRCLPR